MASELATIRGLKHPFNQEKSAADNKRLRSFFKKGIEDSL
jgi:hypothetical protein